MPKILRWMFTGARIVLAFCLAFMMAVECFDRFGPPGTEHRHRETVLGPLLQSHASRRQVTHALALEFTDYSDAKHRKTVGTLPSVRERAKRYPTVLFHTTTWTAIWLFFDAADRLQDYYVGTQ